MAAVEARWRDEVGEERYKIFREVLDQLGHRIDRLNMPEQSISQ